MFKKQHHLDINLPDLKQLIEENKNHTIQIARRIQTKLNTIDEISANMLLLASLKLNNTLDEFFSRVYYEKHQKMLSFYQYLKSLENIDIPEKVIHWINELRVVRNEFVHSADIISTLKIVFSNPLKLMRFIIVVENLVAFTLAYSVSQSTGLAA